MTTALERPKSLTEAKAILSKLAPGEAAPKTLDQARTRIEELTGQKFRSLNPVSDTITQAHEYFKPASRYIFSSRAFNFAQPPAAVEISHQVL
jgi:hypothetical protein